VSSSLLSIIPGGDRYLLIQEMARFGLRVELHKLFRYAKIKGNLFIFVFNHPAGLQEFKISQNAIREKMRIFWRENAKKIRELDISFSNIHGIVIMEKRTAERGSKQSLKFTENAKGDFTVNAKGSIGKLFEDIREIIKGRQNEQTLF